MAETSVMENVTRVPEARYAYYRRCQVFRKGGEQCKAPAEKGSLICHAHAGQLATAIRRERQRRAVLEEAVAQMRKRGRPECKMADLFMDFKGINVTLAVMMQAVIDGRVDCKTAGRMVVQLQSVSKLLWILHRKGREGRKENRISPQIYADERRLSKEKASTTKETRSTPLSQAQGRSGQATKHEGRKDLPQIHTDNTDPKKSARMEDQNRTAEARRRREKPGGGTWAANHLPANHWTKRGHEETRIALVAKVLAVANRRDWPHAPPELLRAA